MNLFRIAIGIERRHSQDSIPLTLPWHFCLVGLISGILCAGHVQMHFVENAAFLGDIRLFFLFIVALALSMTAFVVSWRFRCAHLWLASWILIWHVLGVFISAERVPFMPVDGTGAVTAVVETVDLEVPVDGKRSMDVRVVVWEDGHGRQHRDGRRARLSLQNGEVLEVGKFYSGTMILERPKRPEVPGMVNFGDMLRQKGYGLQIRRKGALREVGPEPGVMNHFKAHLSRHRASAYEKLKRCSPSGILPALALGQGSAVRPEIRGLFSELGIAHVLAVSGLHFGLVAVLVAWVFRHIFQFWTYGVRRWSVQRMSALATIPVLILYIVYVGAPVSAQRACVMCLACLVGRILYRKPDTSRSLGLAALILLVNEPYALFSLGFQLSFCAVLGCIWSSKYYAMPLLSKLEEYIKNPILYKLVSSVIGALIISIGAGWMTMPVLWLQFGQVPVMGILTNLWVIPWVSFILLPASLLMAFLPGSWVAVHETLGWCVAGLERLLTGSVSLFEAYMPLCFVEVLPCWPPVLLSLICALVILYKPKFRRWRFTAMIVCFVGLLVCTAVIQTVQPRFSPPDGLRMTFIAVGQADATLIEFPDGRTMLVDAGREIMRDYDAGAKRVLPCLKSLNIREIDVLVLTHPDYDHYAGLLSIVQNIRIHSVWYNGQHLEEPLYTQIVDALDAQNAKWIRVTSAMSAQHFGETEVRILWPPERLDAEQNDYDRNDLGIVLAVAHGNYRSLLMADVSGLVESEILKDQALSHVNVLKAGHHGSRRSSSPGFLEAVTPDYTLISAGPHNRFGMPHIETLERLYAAQTRIYRTDRDATVRFTTDGKKLRVETRW